VRGEAAAAHSARTGPAGDDTEFWLSPAACRPLLQYARQWTLTMATLHDRRSVRLARLSTIAAGKSESRGYLLEPREPRSAGGLARASPETRSCSGCR